MSIDAQFLDELRSRVSLSEIIGKEIKVTRAGREWKACCPFHHEKTPSFTINDDKQFYHCFGCGAHGDVLRFVMDYKNLSFIDAVEMLALQAGMQVPEQTPQAAAKAKKQKNLYDMMEDVSDLFERNLYEPVNEDALKYMLDRGLSRDTLKQFRIGFAPEDGQVLRKYLLEKGYTDKNMIDAGVVKPSTRGGDPYSFFRDRVMFAVPDRRGRIVAFGGRVLPDHVRPYQRRDFTPPKYINSSETVLFHKGNMLYGEPTARRAAADGQPLILVEGYLDVIACVQAGVEGALAPMGTSVTEEQILTMWKMIPDFTKIPILCFDGDNAGRKAARRICERVLPLLEPGRSVNFAFLPDGEDPDSLIKGSGVKGFKKILSQSMPLFDFIWNSYTQGKEFKTPELRAGVIKQLENEVAKIADRDVQVHYQSLLRQKVSETFFARKSFQGRSRRSPGRVPLKPPVPTVSRVKRLFPRILLAGVINHPNIFDDVEEQLGALHIDEPQVESLRQNLVGFLLDEEEPTREKVMDYLKNSGFAQEIGDICNENVYLHASFCSPLSNGQEIREKWLEYWEDGQAKDMNAEMQSGWRRAYTDANLEQEEKLRNMLNTQESEETS